MLWYITNNGKHTAHIGAEGGINGRSAAKRLFYGCINLKNINFNNNFHTNDTDSMADMFLGCESLTELDLSGFDTSNVTGMSWMFEGCASLTELDLSGFDTSKVTYMQDMFYNCPLTPESAKLRTN